ncbi:MAG TPA: CDP-glycerol glycerophosphotransferase family protein [Microbacterium sp.]|uniref:CDP-glycerol glycerophosphotransferase family protein n=1 Tax=Microbacterium sp. TaxID=51671 RepID=UPI002B4723A8|nr:CDP-glycerol glycerophosphotransferase family protein [Microbacterium sp.]HKT56990.1 CDP-glycerol glycerophosphotransferase family protein [Microbacterium sp.]
MGHQFSVISPMYNVERYLPEFLASLERQTYGLDRLQVILVDDGSTDGTLQLAQEFARDRANVTVLSKPNGGQASARNLGLAAADGDWLTFPDPDDVLSDEYFELVAAAAERASAAHAAVISCRLLMWHEDVGEVKDTHALTDRFRGGEKVVDLERDPEWIQPHVTSGFVRADVVRRAGITFPEELRLRFEDGSFISRYLLNCERPVVVFVPQADYHYRQRADASSTIQSSFADPRKYTDTIRYGFHGVIAEAERLGRPLPRWTQNLFLYDQFWILRSSQTTAVRQASYPETMHDELRDLIPGYLQHVDEDAIRSFDLMPVAQWMRDALLLAKRGSGHSDVYRGADDRLRGLKSFVYRFVGPVPAEELVSDGRIIEPRFTKVQELEYVGRPIAWERTLWVPDDADVRLSLDGVPVEAVAEPADGTGGAFETGPRSAAVRTRVARVRDAIRRRLQGQLLSLLRRDLAVRSPRLASKFAHAWAFIDREIDANDSAEDMYWWVRENHPDVNAWFIVRRGTRDWHRLSKRGARLVAYGSPEFYALLVNADHLASSHADRFITGALPNKYRPARYTFTFLQHGVIKGDLSLWLNTKRVDVLVTSTEAEYDYISSCSPYRLGAKEVRLTGLPRFDVLLERAAADGGQGENVVIMPTWRDYLVGDLGASTDDRPQTRVLSDTRYGAALSDLLHDDRLLALRRERGARLIFMPHPNMRPYLDEFDLPSEIEVFSYADQDVREVVVGARVLVTDYSSVAFNAAYLHRPVVYYQFDQEEYAAGHTERTAYFAYPTHGFGPVAETADEAADAIADAWQNGVAGEYRERMERTFPVRDGRNRERVHRAMLEARTRRDLDERCRGAAPDRWQ